MRRTVVIIASLAAAVLAGCASMSQGECERADWQRRGLEDGRGGYALSMLDEHRSACRKVGIEPDAQRWRLGWSEGIKAYCTPNSAWNAGVNNRFYLGVCADLDEATFLRYFRAGELVYRARQELNQNRGRISKLEDDLKKATKDEDRKRLRDELGRVERERTRLTTLLVTLELAGPPR